MSDLISFKNKKVIIFDLDGTLVDLAVDWQALKNILSERYSKLYKEAACHFESISACLNFIVGRDDENELTNFFDIIRKHELDGIPNSSPIEEAVFFIKNQDQFDINKDQLLAVLSLNTRKCIEKALKLAKIENEFDFIVGREDVRKWKPDPEGLLIIQNHFNLKKEEMIYIGDLPKDLQTGKNAGVEAYLIDEIIKLVKEKRDG